MFYILGIFMRIYVLVLLFNISSIYNIYLLLVLVFSISITNTSKNRI